MSIRFRPPVTSFSNRFINHTMVGCEILMERYTPPTTETGLEEATTLVRTSSLSIAAVGHHVSLDGHHFLLGAHGFLAPGARVFKLIPLPDQVEWGIQPRMVRDEVTGLFRPVGSPRKSTIWVSGMHKGFHQATRLANDETRRYLCSDAVIAGDTLEGRPIRRVYQEQGLLVAEV